MKHGIFLTLILACLLPPTLFAAELRVPQDYPTIQAAVDAAASGDTVLLSDGIYTGDGNCDVQVSKSISIVSKHGPDRTILDCPGSGGIDLDLAGNYCPKRIPGDPFDNPYVHTGGTYYLDRDYILTGVPPQYGGMSMFPLRDNDRDRTDPADYVTFGACCDLEVYVAYDSRAAALPDWMAGFSYTGDDLSTSLAAQDHLEIYRRVYPDGECVNLGANKAPGFVGDEVDNYVVFYRQSGSCGPITIEGLGIKNAYTAVYTTGIIPDPFVRYICDKKFRVSDCVLTGNGTGVNIYGSTGEIRDCRITGSNFGMLAQYSNADVVDTRILNNTTGIYMQHLAGVSVNRSRIGGNTGHGVEIYSEGDIELSNSIVDSNIGNGLWMGFGSFAHIVNSTISGNAGGMRCSRNYYSIDITNSIFWNNGVFEIENPGTDPGALSIRNSNLKGGIAIIGGPVNDLGGNIDEDPGFIDPDGADNIPGTADDDLHLGPGSPCINAGTADLPGGGAFEFDIDGDPRIIGPAPDMGADEALQMLTFYRDRDRDGFGDPLVTVQAGARPRGYVANDGDCNDRRATVHPGALELCNRRDDDCDGLVDEECARKPKKPRAQSMLLPDPIRSGH